MIFWNFFKKNKKQLIKIKKISFDKFHNWLSNEKIKNEKQEQDFLNNIKKRISELILEIKSEISELKNINIENKKTEEKVKLIVKENLDNYVDYLEKLTLKLKEINNKNIIDEINSIFFDFNKKSSSSYEKATYLIGKELKNVRESIKKFFKDLEEILKKNNELINRLNIIKFIEVENENFNKINKIKTELTKDIKKYFNQTNELKKKIKIKQKEIENIKKSDKFFRQIQKKQELNLKKNQLEDNINKLKEIIDFKALANFYHIFEKEMKLIKQYKENFKQSFYKSKGEDILVLLKESKLDNKDILDKINNIKEKIKKINAIVIEKTGIEELESQINKMNLEIQEINSKKLIRQKKLEKLKLNINKTIKTIKEKLSEINIELE